MKGHCNSKGVCISLLLIAFIFIFNGCARDKTVLKETSTVHLRLGVSYFSEGDTTSALQELMKAKELNPDDPQVYLKFSEAHNNLGTVYMDLKQWDNAIFEFKEALSNDLYSTPERAYCNMGWAYYKHGDIGKAIGNYKKALELAPGFVLAHYNLGIGYFSINKVKEAIDELKLVIKLDPKFVDAHYQMGLAYLKLDRKAEAIEEFEEVAKTSPSGENRDSAKRYLDLLK
ncbi:MAG: TPR repeat-containing protein [bacterium]|nr:MAG: TPR repeat-containing protein [bacterium]